jgi:D-alanyl-lipoteichoic acid acyltransferase DltB (MBOAT superfamily)
MIFTDAKFFAFFPLTFAVYWWLGDNRSRKQWLLICSVIFYAAWDWRFLGVVLAVILNTYFVTRLVGEWAPERWRGRILTAGIAISLAVLGFFKYYNFFADSLARVTPVSIGMRDIVLPIGISFYTFHSISYMIDSYQRKIAPAREFVDVALYILFFPQLVAGPIVRATDLLPQLRESRSIASVNFKYQLTLFLIGYFKKAVISDNLSPAIDRFFAHPAGFGAGDATLAVVFYAVQIYCDFSGYTDMAIAIAGMLGYQLKPNFAHPYLASNLNEFWRRWHMSLTGWFRDYVYFPLSLTGVMRGRWPLVLLVTFLITGLWHGASWTFVFWGGLHGLGLILHRVVQTFRSAETKPRYSIAGNLLTFAFVCFAWIFFRAPDFATAAAVLGRFAVPTLPTLVALAPAAVALAAFVAVHVLSYRVDLNTVLARTDDFVFAAAYGAAAALVLPFVNVAVKPFIYFQF